MNVIANITLLVAAVLDMIVLLGADITDHRNNGSNNSKYYGWLNKNSELLSTKRLLVLAVFLGTFTTMAQESWMVVMILAAVLLAQAIYLLSKRQWKLLDDGNNAKRMLLTATIIALIILGAMAYFGSKTSTLFASRVASMAAVMIPPVTWLLTMITAWALRIRPDVTDSAQQDPED